MHRKDEEDILVLDAVGVCEDLTVPNSAPPPNDNYSCSQDQAKLLPCPDGPLSPETTHGKKDALTGLTAELDDDILSIMCNDNEEDLLDVDSDGSPEKRDWNSEARLASKRKPDQLANTSQPVNSKRPRLMYKTSPQCRERPQTDTMHNRLGRHKPFQFNHQESQKPYFRSSQNGKYHYRDSWQFLHSNRSRDNELVSNWHSRMENYDNKIGSYHAHQMMELQQKLQDQEMQLKQQSAQLQSMAHNLLNMEHVANHAANQAKKVQESCYHLWQQREQLNHANDVLEQLGRDHCKMGEHVQTLQDQVQHLEANEYSQLDILAHYQFIANFQRRQLQHFTRKVAGTASAGSGNTLQFLQLPDLRCLPPLGKPAVCAPQPRSADSSHSQQRSTGSHNPSQMASLQYIPSSSHPYIPPSSHPSNEGEGSQPALRPSSTFQVPSSLVHTSRIPLGKIPYHTPSTPRVVRIVPVQQQCPDDPRLLVDYQHKSPTMRLQ